MCSGRSSTKDYIIASRDGMGSRSLPFAKTSREPRGRTSGAPLRYLSISRNVYSKNCTLRMGDACIAPAYVHTNDVGQALGRLVMLGYALPLRGASTCILSTRLSSWVLTTLGYGISHLGVGFVLICFQHLSAPNTATLRLPLAR